MKVWEFRRGVDEAMFALYLVDDKGNPAAGSRNNNVEKGILMWKLFYVKGEFAYEERTNFTNKTHKKFGKTFRQNKA